MAKFRGKSEKMTFRISTVVKNGKVTSLLKQKEKKALLG